MNARHAITRTAADHGRRGATGRIQAPVAPAADALSLLSSLMCPTCLAGDDPDLDTMPGATHPGVAEATCPTCGVTSIEYGLTLAIDATLGEMACLDRLDAAL